MICIKQIGFENYRIAGTCNLTLNESENEYHLYGIIAENGIGKTTILNAITWCLYNEEYQLKDKQTSLPIINSKKLNEMAVNECATVCVQVTIGDEDKEIVFRRSVSIKKRLNADGVSEAIVNPNSELVVIESDLNSSESTKSYRNDDALNYVAEYFDNRIHNFFFFDGEKLDEMFTTNKAQSIKTSVEAIAQISLVDSVIDNATSIKQKKMSAISKNKPDLLKMEHDIKILESKCEKDNEFKRGLEEDKERYRNQKAEIDNLLSENQLSVLYQNQKEDYEARLDEINNSLRSVLKEKTRLAVRSMTLIKLYPRIITALRLIEEKESSGDISVFISRKNLEQILKDVLEHASRCPICGSKFDNSNIMHLHNIISSQTISDDQAVQLRNLKDYLNEAKNEILKFRDEYHSLQEREAKLQDERTRLESERDSISEKIAALGMAKDGNGKVIDFKAKEAERRDLESRISLADQSIGVAISKLRQDENELSVKKKGYEDAIKRQNEDKNSQQVIDALQMIISNLTLVKERITKEVRVNLQEKTERMFKKIVWKKETFGKISIDKAYKLALYDEYGQIMTGSSSATEYMGLAYAFTFAIHESTGHNCPLVIDSPLGRISGKIRENTANMLLQASKEKQIIMLLTEVEYSSEVKNLFEDKATIKRITLASHEGEWEGVK